MSLVKSILSLFSRTSLKGKSESKPKPKVQRPMSLPVLHSIARASQPKLSGLEIRAARIAGSRSKVPTKKRLRAMST